MAWVIDPDHRRGHTADKTSSGLNRKSDKHNLIKNLELTIESRIYQRMHILF